MKLLSYRFPVHRNILESDILCIVHLNFLIRGEDGMGEPDAADRQFWDAVDKDRLVGALADDVAEDEVAEFGGRLIDGLDVGLAVLGEFGSRHAGIIEIEHHAVIDDIFHVNPVAPDVAD